MDEQPNLRTFVAEISSFGDDQPAAPGERLAPKPVGPLPVIGKVVEIAGSGSQASFDASILNQLLSHADPSIAMSGQVGSQVKMTVAGSWLIANVRTLRNGGTNEVIAQIDFLGEGSCDS